VLREFQLPGFVGWVNVNYFPVMNGQNLHFIEKVVADLMDSILRVLSMVASNTGTFRCRIAVSVGKVAEMMLGDIGGISCWRLFFFPTCL
jgi:hypothetical protein